jgi:hypothetical protein
VSPTLARLSSSPFSSSHPWLQQARFADVLRCTKPSIFAEGSPLTLTFYSTLRYQSQGTNGVGSPGGGRGGGGLSRADKIALGLGLSILTLALIVAILYYRLEYLKKRLETRDGRPEQTTHISQSNILLYNPVNTVVYHLSNFPAIGAQRS